MLSCISLQRLTRPLASNLVTTVAEVSTDHHLVVSWILWQGRMLHRPGIPRCLVRVRSEYLLEALIYDIFLSHSNFDNVQRRQGTLVRTDCSTSPLPRWLYRAVAASRFDTCCGNNGDKGSCQFQEGALSGWVIIWDSKWARVGGQGGLWLNYFFCNPNLEEWKNMDGYCINKWN